MYLESSARVRQSHVWVDVEGLRASWRLTRSLFADDGDGGEGQGSGAEGYREESDSRNMYASGAAHLVLTTCASQLRFPVPATFVVYPSFFFRS